MTMKSLARRAQGRPVDGGGAGRRYRAATGAVALAGVLTLAACGGGGGGSGADAAEGDAAVTTCDADVAAEEGAVTYYATDEPEVASAIAEGFNKEYPDVEVTAVQGDPRSTREKIIAEAAAGQVNADVAIIGGNSLTELTEGGFLEAYRAPGAENVYEGTLGEEGYNNPRTVNAYGITVNTDLVPEADWPSDWDDLTDPKYKGLIAVQDPHGSGPGMSVFQAMLDKYGEDFMRDLAEQEIVFGDSGSQLQTDVARGEVGILLTSAIDESQALADDGAPVAVIAPESGFVLAPISMAVVKDAPHPAAARCFVDWMLSVEGQEVLASLDLTPAREDVPAANPELDVNKVGVMVLENFDVKDPNLTEELSAKWDEIFF